jgi:hypothetical protein
MSIVPHSALSRAELSQLGNNVSAHPAVSVRRRRRRRNRVLTAAVNRSLAHVGERIAQLYSRRPLAVTA